MQGIRGEENRQDSAHVLGIGHGGIEVPKTYGAPAPGGHRARDIVVGALAELKSNIRVRLYVHQVNHPLETITT